ncbi:MAG: hypothetical protein ACXQT5_08580 [Candidatus Syntropharchaeia archaeon]
MKMRDEEEEIMDALKEMFAKNQKRSRILVNFGFDDLWEEMGAKELKKEKARQMVYYFCNWILDTIMGIVPPETAFEIEEILDQHLCIEQVNRKCNVNLIEELDREFVEKYGDKFESEEEFEEIARKFDEEWLKTPRKDLGGKTPEEAMAEFEI